MDLLPCRPWRSARRAHRQGNLANHGRTFQRFARRHAALAERLRADHWKRTGVSRRSSALLALREFHSGSSIGGTSSSARINDLAPGPYERGAGREKRPPGKVRRKIAAFPFRGRKANRHWNTGPKCRYLEKPARAPVHALAEEKGKFSSKAPSCVKRMRRRIPRSRRSGVPLRSFVPASP
jgi:hypothetical protein